MPEAETIPAPTPRILSGWRRRAVLVVGHALFLCGLAGLFVPLLPTTVFWIGAVWCFARSAPKMRARILAWPGVGPAISDYVEHGVLSRPAKQAALIGLAVALAIGLAATWSTPWVAVLLTVTLLAVAAYVARRPVVIEVQRT